MAQNVLVIGGSRNIGYLAAIRFLAAGSTVTFLLRHPTAFDKDGTIQEYIKSGKAHIVKGDALVQDNVKHAWDEAITHGPVDLLLFTVGASSGKLHPLKGVIISPPNLVTQSLLNALSTLPSSQVPQPKVITISSRGITRTSRAATPLALKPVYGYLIELPLRDKTGAARATAHVAGWEWDPTEDGEPGEDIIGKDWMEMEGLPAAGAVKRVLEIRPAMLTDGECVAESKKGKEGKGYKVGADESCGWKISRRDVAHFVFDAAVNRWDEFENKRVNLSY